MSYRLTAKFGGSLLLWSALTLPGVVGCQSAEPKPDAPQKAVSKQADSQASPQGEASEERASEDEAKTEASQDEPSRTPPETVALTLEVSPEMVTLDGDEILPLEDGFIQGVDYQSRFGFDVKGLLEPVEAALEAERRRRVVYGEASSVGRLVVKAHPEVPADTLFSLQYTLAKSDLEWMTVEVGDVPPTQFRLTRDFTRRRLVRWSDRKTNAVKLYAQREQAKREPAKQAQETQKAPKKTGEAHQKHKVLGAGPLENIFGNSNSKMNVALSGTSQKKIKSKQKSGLVVGRGFGGLGLRGVGKSGGGKGFGRISGLGKVATSKKRVAGRGTVGVIGGVGYGGLGYRLSYCSKNSDDQVEPLALTHATIKLYPTKFDAWLSERHSAYPAYMRRQFGVDPAEVDGVDSYPWWKLYNALSRMQSYYGEADSLIVWLHPSLSGKFLAAAGALNCKLPQKTYPSQDAWKQARAEVDACEPIFQEQFLGNGMYPKGEQE